MYLGIETSEESKNKHTNAVKFTNYKQFGNFNQPVCVGPYCVMRWRDVTNLKNVG